MSGFTKLVPEILQSSIWNESSDVRIVWITLLAAKNEEGYVRGDCKTIARLANVPIAAVEQAMAAFQEPDLNSHTPDNEGRRICPAPGGWIVLNHALYRGRDERAAHAEYVREWRKGLKIKNNVIKCESQVNTSDIPSASVSVSASESGLVGGCKGEEQGVTPLRGVTGALPFSSDGFVKAWSDWEKHRKEKRAKLTPTCIEKQLKMLSLMTEADAVATINHSIEKGWTGLFQPDACLSKGIRTPVLPLKADHSKGFFGDK